MTADQLKALLAYIELRIKHEAYSALAMGFVPVDPSIHELSKNARDTLAKIFGMDPKELD
jgi:hypothetical protein